MRNENISEPAPLTAEASKHVGERLDLAIARGSLDEVRLAIDSGASVEQKSRALLLAAIHGRADCAKILIPEADIQVVGAQAVQIAAKHNRVDVLGLLLEANANAKAKKSHALTLAAGKGHLNCVNLLIPRSDPGAQHSLALTCAVESGSMDCVMALLPACDPLAVSDAGVCARSAAVEKKNWSMVELFDAHCDSIELAKVCAGGEKGAKGPRL